MVFSLLDVFRSSQSKPVLLQRGKHQINDATSTTSENKMSEECCDKWQEIACGIHHIVGVTPTGDLYSWGYGTEGQLGQGNKDSSNRPKLIDKNLFCKKAQHVACGMFHTVVLTTEGEVYTW